MDRLSKPIKFKSGVRWEPEEYVSIDQTPYLAYLEKQEDRTGVTLPQDKDK